MIYLCLFACKYRNFLLFRLYIARINFFQLVFICRKQFFQRKAFTAESNRIAGCRAQKCPSRNIFRHFQKERAVSVTEQVVQRNTLRKCKADVVAHSHFHYSLSNAAICRCIRCRNFALPHQSVYDLKILLQAFRCRQSVCIILRLQKHNIMPCRLKFRGNNIMDIFRSHRKGNQCRRHVNLFERPAHGILSADCRNFQPLLRHKSTQKRSQRFAPASAVFHGLLKIFLKGKINLLKLCACRNQLCNRFHNRQICTVVRAFLRDKRIISPCHQGAGRSILFLRRNLIYHCLNGCALVFAAKRHQHRTRANSRVKTLGKPALGADVQVFRQFQIALFEIRWNFF